MRGRGWFLPTMVGATLLLAACAPPAGTDGKIANDWAELPAAVMWSPATGDCHASGFVDSPTYDLYRPIACAEQHTVETVHVGKFAGEHETRDTPPPEGSPGIRVAYGECVTKAAEFLGDDWRAGRVWLGVAVPTTGAWEGGARWFRCDLWEVKSKDAPDDVPRTGSLKDTLKGNRPLGYGCYLATIKNNVVDSMAAVECTKPHNAEFAGLFVAPDVPYPKTEKERDDQAFTGCRGVIATYAGIPNDGNFQYRTGQIISPYTQEEWELGNRGVRCHLWFDKNVTRSMKGAGTKVLPVN